MKGHTQQIIDDLILEDELRGLPEEVHTAFRKKVYTEGKKGFFGKPAGSAIPSAKEQEIIKQHPVYAGYVKRVIRLWLLSEQIKCQHRNLPPLSLANLLKIVNITNYMSGRYCGDVPFYLNNPEEIQSRIKMRKRWEAMSESEKKAHWRGD